MFQEREKHLIVICMTTYHYRSKKGGKGVCGRWHLYQIIPPSFLESFPLHLLTFCNSQKSWSDNSRSITTSTKAVNSELGIDRCCCTYESEVILFYTGKKLELIELDFCKTILFWISGTIMCGNFFVSYWIEFEKFSVAFSFNATKN